MEIRRVVVDLPFDLAIGTLTHALENEGVSILSQSDLQQYLVRTVHHDFRRYVLLEVAMPNVALEALLQDLAVGAILPAPVAVFELADGATAVVIGEPFGGVGTNAEWRSLNPLLADLFDQTCDRLARALAELAHKTRVHRSGRGFGGAAGVSSAAR